MQQNMNLNQYLQQPFAVKNVMAFCRDALNGIASPSKFRFSFVWFPAPTNAWVTIRKRPRKSIAVVHVNLYCFKPKNLSVCVRYFNLYTSLLHEIEHLRLMEAANREPSTDYLATLATWEYVLNCEQPFYLRLVRAMVRRVAQIKAPSQVSAIELYCLKRSHDEAFRVFESYFTPNDLASVEERCKAISLLSNSLEIDYSGVLMIPCYRFAYVLSQTQKRIRRAPQLYEKYPLLETMFLETGDVRAVRSIYETAQRTQYPFFYYFLLRLFMEAYPVVDDMILQDSHFQEHIASVAAEYCREAISFIQNKHIVETWFGHTCVEDNTAMLVKNLIKLSKQMDRFDMPHCAGGVIPLYVAR